jgi:hypothetical protein
MPCEVEETKTTKNTLRATQNDETKRVDELLLKSRLAKRSNVAEAESHEECSNGFVKRFI